jgi:sporulation protein YlmC with PRC-barrel domain
MTKISKTLLVGAALLAIATAGQTTSPALSQGAPQTISLLRVDLQSLTTGYRTSKIVGSPVFNELNESIGTIDDLIVTPNDKVPFAVLSVGGFLGLGTKYVVVSFSSIELVDKRLILRGATKDGLKALPDYKYAS